MHDKSGDMGNHKPLRQGNWKQQWNWNCKECLPDHVDHVELVCAVHTEKTATQPPYHSWKTKQLHSQETELSSLLKSCTVQWFHSFQCVIFFVVVQMAQKVNEATDIAFVQ